MTVERKNRVFLLFVLRKSDWLESEHWKRLSCSSPMLLSIEAKPEVQKEEGGLAKVTW